VDGTSRSRFTSWYAQNSSPIAGKTGTNESTKKNENGSIWFVGMTPHLVAASGLINFDQSSAPSTGIPHMKTGHAYGDYAAKLWLAALKPTLDRQHWAWPSPDEVDGDQVPNVTGQTIASARKTLAANHFKMTVLDDVDQLRCPSSVLPEMVAYYAPKKAPPGSTITVCPSLGVPAYQPPPPPPPPPSKTKKRSGQSSAPGGHNRTTRERRVTRTRHRPPRN
jgi:membrane peptidoglycan carboxypeptidase